MAQVLGIVDIVWQGRNIAVEKGAKIKLGGIKNNKVVYGRRVDRAQEFMASEVSATTHLRKGERLTNLINLGEGELQVVCDTGQSFVFPDAFLEGEQEAQGGEGGKIELKWAAGDWQEVLN